MEHYLDIETERFEKIKEHEMTWILVPRRVAGREIGVGDVLKLYHPGDPTEAIRVEVTDVQTADAGQEFIRVSFVLLEWMCRLETELDELLREEEQWMRGLL